MEEIKEKKYEIDMVHGPILGKLLLFALPLMFSSILQLLFNAADIIVVGRFAGENSLAAVGCNTSIIALLTNLFIGISIGSNVLAARFYGAGQEKHLNQTVQTAMSISMVSGVVLTIVGILGARLILTLMNTPVAVIDLAVLYLRIYFLGMTAMMIYNFGSSLLRAVGDTRRPLIYLAVAGIINVCLNLIFVIKFNMGVAGVGAATAISQCVSAVLILRCLMRESGGLKLSLKDLHIYNDKMTSILKIGLPAGFQGMLFSISNVIIQAAVNGFGAVVVAGNSASSNIESFVFFSMNAFYQAAISFTSQNMGAGNYKRIYKILWRALGCVTVTALVLGGSAVLFSDQLLSIYSTKPAVIWAGSCRLKIVCSTYALCGIMDVMVGMIRGMGYSIMPTIVSLLGACAFRIVWISTLFQIPQFHTTDTIYYSYPVSWLVTMAAQIICFIWAWRKLNRENKLQN